MWIIVEIKGIGERSESGEALMKSNVRESLKGNTLRESAIDVFNCE